MNIEEKQINVLQPDQLVNLLNQALADAIDLQLQAKQAHWNVKGENFIALHELFDKVADEAHEYADMLAERVVQLGGIALGTLQTVAIASRLTLYPKDIQCSKLHVAALATAVATVADNARQLIDISDELGDKVTADMCTEIARGLDKLRWFVGAHKS